MDATCKVRRTIDTQLVARRFLAMAKDATVVGFEPLVQGITLPVSASP